MGAYYQHRCDLCGYAFETSGPWTFFETVLRERCFSDHQDPSSDHIGTRIIKLGLSIRVFCPGCRRLVNLVLAKHVIFPGLEQPRRGLLESIWNNRPEAPPLPQISRLPPCPHCGGEKFILACEPSAAHRCPHCGAGTMLAYAA